MTTNSRAKAQAFKETLEGKIRGLIEEFAEGKINREQFHVIYEKYNAQLQIANHALLSGNPDAVQIAQGGPPTLSLRDAHMAKALGLLIYHNRSSTVLETLGDFETDTSKFQNILDIFTKMMVAGKLIDRRVEKFDARWLSFAAGRYSTIVTSYSNQPAEIQNREIERLHYDFESANRVQLASANVDTQKLAYPFLVFIKKKYKK